MPDPERPHAQRDRPGLSGTVPASVSGGVIVLAVALAVAGGIIAGMVGGWRAARLRPADALSKVA